jgi:hypothetical protein
MVLNLSAKVLCHYTNNTGQYQIIRISNIPCWFFERTVFPGSRVTFRAFPHSLLEVHTGLFSGLSPYDLSRGRITYRFPVAHQIGLLKSD